MSMTMDLIRHIAGLYSGKAIKGDITQVYITGNEIWMAQQILASQQRKQAAAAENARVHPEQAAGAHVPDDVFEAEFMAWWEEEGQYCRSGGGDYERTFAFQAWRHLYPQLMQARAALAQPYPAPELPTEDDLEEAGLGYPRHKEEAVKLWYAGFRSEVITVLEAWEAIGHDIGMNPDKGELLASLRYMLEKCEAHDAALARVAELEAQAQHSVPEASEQEKEQGWTLDYRFV